MFLFSSHWTRIISTTDKITQKNLLFKKAHQKTYHMTDSACYKIQFTKKRKKTSMMSALMTIIVNMITVDKVSKVHEELLYF